MAIDQQGAGPGAAAPHPGGTSNVRLVGVLLALAAGGYLLWWSIKPFGIRAVAWFDAATTVVVHVVAVDPGSAVLVGEVIDAPPSWRPQPVVSSERPSAPSAAAGAPSDVDVGIGQWCRFQPDPQVAEQIKSLSPATGALWRLQLASRSDPTIRRAELVTAQAPRGAAIRLVVAGVLFVVSIPIAVLGRRSIGLIRGVDNRYSKSLTQAALWFTIAISGLVAACVLRASSFGPDFLGGITISQNLVLLSGFSAITLAGAKWIRVAGDTPTPPRAAADSGISCLVGDLAADDSGNVSLADVQMLVLMVIASAIYVVSLIGFLESIPATPAVALPDVDGAILALAGISQGTYLVHKQVSSPDPGGA